MPKCFSKIALIYKNIQHKSNNKYILTFPSEHPVINRQWDVSKQSTSLNDKYWNDLA